MQMKHCFAHVGSSARKRLGNKVGWVPEACGQHSELIQTAGPVPEGPAACPSSGRQGEASPCHQTKPVKVRDQRFGTSARPCVPGAKNKAQRRINFWF